jgi:hypothetical protein
MELYCVRYSLYTFALGLIEIKIFWEATVLSSFNYAFNAYHRMFLLCCSDSLWA